MKRRYALLALPILAAMPARADDCATLFNMMIAQAATPYSATVSMDGVGAMSGMRKTVFTGDTVYTQIDGKWKSMPMNAKETTDMMREAQKTAKETCHLQGMDSVNGQPAQLYVSHVENRGSVSDNKVWVAGSRVLKTDAQIKGGMHVVMVFDYNNVTAPAGATPLTAPSH